MASSSPGMGDAESEANVCVVGLSPFVESKTADAEELIQKQFYKVLQEYNTEPVLRMQMNTKLDIHLSKIKFTYSEGDQMVTATMTSKTRDDMKKVLKCLTDYSLANFLSDFLDNIGLNIELGICLNEKVEILVFEIENQGNNSSSSKPVTKIEDIKANNGNAKSTIDSKDKVMVHVKAVPVLFRIYVPFEKVRDVSVLSKKTRYKTTHIPETFIWTVTIESVDRNIEFQIVVDYIKVSGLVFKEYNEDTLYSSVIKDWNRNTILHIVFPSKKTETFEKAFVAFCSNILQSETFNSMKEAFLQLEAMSGFSNPLIDVCVNYRSLIKGRAPEFIKEITKSLPNGLHARNIPAFCYILNRIVNELVYCWPRDLVDENIAKCIVEQMCMLKPDQGFSKHMKEIGQVLENLFLIAYGTKACAISFIGRTLTFLNEEYHVRLVQSAIGKKDCSMPFYVYTEQLQADAILLKILNESKQTLLDKILRHLPHYCNIVEYVLVMKILLKNSEEKTTVIEKLIDSCRQKCSLWIVQETKTGNLTGVLNHWRTMQNLEPTTYDTLLPIVEKGILECIGNDLKLEGFDKRPEFMHAVLEGPLFRSFDSQYQLLKRLADSKRNLRTCVVDLLAEERFQALPDDQFAKVVKLFLQNSLQLDKKKYSSEERIVKAYEYLCVLFKLFQLQHIANLRTEIDEMVFKSVEQYNTKELMRAVVHIENNEDQQRLFQNHMKKILGKHSKKSTRDIIQDICGTEHLRIRSRLTASIFKDIIDLLEISEDDKPEKVFGKALEHASFWTEIFTAEGNEIPLYSLQKYKPCLKVMDTFAKFKRAIQTKQLNCTQIHELKIKESEMLQLLSCVLDSSKGETKQKLESSWKNCYTTLIVIQENINLIREIFHTLKVRVAVEDPPPIVSQTLDFLTQIQSKIQEDEILVADIIKEDTLGSDIKEIAEYCRLLIKPVKSQVFWNILHDEFRQIINVETENRLDGNNDPLDGMSLPEMFEEDYELEVISSFNTSKTISFITYLSNSSLDKYKQIWTPYFKRENRPLEEFKKTFARIKSTEDMKREIMIAEEFCNTKSHPLLRNTLLKFADLMTYGKTVEAVQISLKIFKFKTNVETYTDVLNSFHKFFKVKKGKEGNLQDMFMKDMEAVLDRVERIRQFVSTEVTEILEVLKQATSLLQFLEEVIDEDIRNLIDAVEEHSEQYVRESTVSDLIEVKRFFYPILKKKYGDEFTDFFSLLQKQLKSGFTNIPAKINDCMENLHTLRALYKNVANRGERTKEIIDSIVDRGKFCFRMEIQTCEVIVKYKQDKKNVSHNSSDLSDLRSRALLLMNAEDREKTKQKTRRRKDDLETFLLLVDTAFQISSMCLELKRTGHFGYDRYENSFDLKELFSASQNLKAEYEDWIQNLATCRRKYYYMNFIHPAQLQQLFVYLCKSTGNERNILTCLQFIDTNFKNVQALKNKFQLLPTALNNREILQNISITLQNIFKNHCPLRQKLSNHNKKAKITDIVQAGVPYIAALNTNCPLVIRTMFALYRNTTNSLPIANQVLLCRGETGTDEIDLFLRRCIEKPSIVHERGLYCIANVEMLSNDVQTQFVENLLHLPNGDYLLSVIFCGHSHHPFLDSFSDRLSRPSPMTETLLEECLRNHWPDVLVISSDVPGLGKTELIHKQAREEGMSVATMHLSGIVSMESIIRNLQDLNLKKYNLLHIDVGITSTPSELDNALFQLIVLGHLSTGSMAYTLETKHVSIEISNTVGQTLCNSLPTTTCFHRKNIDWNNYYDMKVSMEVNSPVQVVCHYLKAFEKGTIDRNDIYFTGSNAVKPLKADECISLLEKCLSSVGDMSYSLLQTFVNVLSDQLKKLSASVFFRTSSISAMIGDETIPTVKSNLVKALVNASQEFACRSVQTCRSLQEASMVVSATCESFNETNSAEELAKRVAGMIRWEDSNHLMILFHQNVQTVSALYRDKSKITPAICTLFESQMKKNLDDFETKSQRELQEILQMLTRNKPNKLSAEVLDELALDYALTPDNLLKMILISLRINSCIPIVIMGETGCGKTSLVRYLAEVCEVNFVLMSIHAGVDQHNIIKKAQEVNEKAKADLNISHWLFLDEINTCDHLGIINSILCHRFLQGEILAPNITVLAACNPYRLRSQSTIMTAGLQGKVKTDELSRLVYRVHPLPEALIDYVWDYGSLNEKDEKLYISKMVANAFSCFLESDLYETILTELLAMSQNLVRVMESTDSCVSLRDVDRCKKLVVWFLKFLRMKETKTAYNYGIEMKAIVLALAVSYHSRFADVETRADYRDNVSMIISKNHYPITADTILEIIRDEEDEILNRMVLPNGIAKNRALQENVFVVLVCILNKIPIFLVGKPGCSKSLSIQLIRSNLRGRDSKDELFQSMAQLFCVSFQGSESSTSDGIIKVFEKAENYQKLNDKDVISVVILDEIGLAEVSRFNPLKVLHGLLEPGSRQTPNVAVVGISNWALDAAKMNRAVHLSRPDMNVEELKYTGNSIISAMIDTNEQDWGDDLTYKQTYIPKTLKYLFDEIAVAYFKYVSERQKYPNFHGLRDYYSLIKYIGRCYEELTNGTYDSEADVLLKGIARNFGGLPTEMAGVIGVFRETFLELKHKLIPVTDLIKDNLNDGLCRHLMLITNGDAVISVLESHLNEIQRPFEIIFGSHFDDDLSDDYNYRILSRIILCMEQGIVLILKGLESIYGSLYDMLNQNYTVVGKKKNCRVALGHYSNPMCHVHDSFKCIVLVEETKLDYSDPPFLNRFEKQQFRFSDMIENELFGQIIDEIAEICEAMCRIEGYMFSPEIEIPSYSRDLLVSLILHLRRLDPSDHINKDKYLDEALNILLWLIPPEVIVRARESRLCDINASQVEKMIEFYMELPVHEGLSCCLNKLLNNSSGTTAIDKLIPNFLNGELLLCYTYTNMHCNVRSIVDVDTYQIDRLASFKSEKQLTYRIEDFFNTDKSVLLLQCSATHDSQHLLLSKVIIENIRRKTEHCQKHVCMIIHLDRSVAHAQQFIPINYLSGWKIFFLDSLERPETSTVHFLKLSKYDIVHERKPLNDYIVDNLFWAFTRIKFTTQNNSVENQQRLIEQIKKNDIAISVIEELIMKWIEDQTSENSTQWCTDVAKSTHELYRSGSLVRAFENTIHDLIKTPLAMYLFRMLELQILSPVFVDDISSDRVQIWRQIVLSEAYTNINEMPPITGPECYACNAPFLDLKMPLSRMFIDKINSQKDDFMDITRKLRVHNDILLDEDIPLELFENTVYECTDIICHDVDDIINVQYEERIEDYVSDFCSVSSFGLMYSHDEIKARKVFQWSLKHFIPNFDLQTEDMLHVMALVHAAWWINGPAISSTCKLIEFSEQVINISWDRPDIKQLSEDEAPEEIDILYISELSRKELVDHICRRLLPVKRSLSFSDWIRITRVIIPIAREVSYESTIMPSLQICHEIVCLLVAENFDPESVYMLGKLFRENDGQINASAAFSVIISILKKLKVESSHNYLELQRFYCSYIMRCLYAHPDDNEVLMTALNMIGHNDSFDTKLSFFGKCIDFAVTLDNLENDDLIRNIVLGTNEDHPPFIECLDNFLTSLDISEKQTVVLPCLLVDVIQNSCLKLSFKPDCLFQIESVSNDSISCLLEAYNIACNEPISFRYIAAIAYLKHFLKMFYDTLKKPEFYPTDMPIVCQHVNNLLSNKWKSNADLCNPFLIYLFRLFASQSGIERITRRCKDVQNIMTVLQNIKWNMNYMESTFVLDPLSVHMNSENKARLLHEINSVLEKDNTLEALLNDDGINSITLLGTLSQRFYMRRCLNELNDTESRMGKKISEMIMKSNRPDEIKHICRYLLGEEFGHDLFALSEASERPYLQITSVILHFCSLISTSANKSNIWYSCLFHPEASLIQLLPCVNKNDVSEAEDMVCRILTDSVVIGSMGFNFTTGIALLSDNFTIDPANYFKQDLITHFDSLERLFQMNSSDLCILLHWVILKCENIITQECSVSTQSNAIDNKSIKIIRDIIQNRWEIVHDAKMSYSIGEEETSDTEAYVDEIVQTSAEHDFEYTFLLNLLRISQTPTKDTLLNEIQLRSGEHVFLDLLFENMRRLSMPKFIISLLRWNMSVITYASYKFRKVDFKDLPVQKFLSKEVEDSRRNILRKHFDQFKKSWNEIREKYSDVISKEIADSMEPMTTMEKMEACMILNNDSILLSVLEELVNIHNSFLNQSAEMVANRSSNNIKTVRHTLSLLDVKTTDVIAFEWNDDWLRFCQCETENGLGQKVIFDFERIEDEIRKQILFGKVEIQFPASFPKPVFTDDLFQKSVELLSEIETCIPQQYLTTEIKKSVEMKVDRDASFVTDLLSRLGMILSLLKKTGGDNSQPLIEYVEKWQSVTGMNSNIVKRILPEPVDSVKLGHVVTLYKWLEELNGASLVESLDKSFHRMLPTEATYVLQKMTKSSMIHLEKLQHPLLVFVHRCLALKKTDIRSDYALADYINSSDLWWKEDFDRKGVIAGPDKKIIPLTEILSPFILIEHVCETVLFIQEAVKLKMMLGRIRATPEVDFDIQRRTRINLLKKEIPKSNKYKTYNEHYQPIWC